MPTRTRRYLLATSMVAIAGCGGGPPPGPTIGPPSGLGPTAISSAPPTVDSAPSTPTALPPPTPPVVRRPAPTTSSGGGGGSLLAIPSWGLTGADFYDETIREQIDSMIRTRCGGDLCLPPTAAQEPCLIKAVGGTNVVDTMPPAGTKVERGTPIVFRCQADPVTESTTATTTPP